MIQSIQHAVAAGSSCLTRFSKWAVGAGLCLGITGLLHAQEVEPVVVVSHPTGANIRDTNGNGDGDAVQSSGVQIWEVGEVLTNPSDRDQGRPFIPFVLSTEEREAVAQGGRVELAISYGAFSNVANVNVNGVSTDLKLDIFGFLERTSEIPVAADYQNPDVVLLHAGAITPATATGIRVYDVTEFVKAQSAFGPVVAFRLQIDPPDALPNTDGIVNRYRIHSRANDTATRHPRLRIYPKEPNITAGAQHHRNIADTTGDGEGDTIDSGGDTLGRVGEYTQDVGQSRWYLPFQLDSMDIASIEEAEAVTLNLFFGLRTAVMGLFLDGDPSIQVEENGQGRSIRDTTGNGIGDTVDGPDTLIRVGEHTQDVDQSRYFMPFTLTQEQRDAVANGERVNLSFSFGTATNVTGLNVDEEIIDLNIDLYGFVGREPGAPQPADYDNEAVVLLQARALHPTSSGGIHTFDVTDFVKEQSAAGELVAFRLQIDRADALPYADGAFNRYLLHSQTNPSNPAPRLAIYPEWPVPTTDLRVEIVGFNNRTSLTATAADYHASGVEVLHSPASGMSSTGYYSYDITAFAKQEIANGNILAFRLQINHPDALPFVDQAFNRYLFHSANNPSGNRPFIQVYDELPFTTWKKERFSPEDWDAEEISGPFADPDGDGIHNLMEYALGGHPLTADRSILPEPGITEVNGEEYLTITFTRQQNPLDISYSVDAALDLEGWIAGGAVHVETIDHEDGTITQTYRSPDPITDEERSFLRLRVNQVF